MASRYLEYALGRSDRETQRLVRQAELLKPFTVSMLEEAGLAPGMKVLDIGCGPGDVAFLAAELVGATGLVIGIDQNAAAVETARQRGQSQGAVNVTFVVGDLRTADLDHDFDAVVGRHVLLYVPDPAQALRQLVTCLRPGGVVAIQELETGPVSAYYATTQVLPLMTKVFQWVDAALSRSGANPSTGFGLLRIFQDAGLGVPEMAFHAAVGASDDWWGYDGTADTCRSLLPFLTKYEIATPEEVGIDTLADRLRAEVAQARHPVVALPGVTAWVRTKGP